MENAMGKVSLSYLWAYPPGIPLLVPGERVDETAVEIAAAYQRAGIPLHFIGTKGEASCLEIL